MTEQEKMEIKNDFKGFYGKCVISKAPFPWFGGKSRVATLVWRHFGNVQNYVEPFAGSLAVLLGRTSKPKIETVNDADCYLANFWRALVIDPNGVATHADWPVNEADLTARHQWLVNQAAFRERMKTDPDYYDIKIAGWWAWGLCAWIGGGWCEVGNKCNRRLPHLSSAGRGVNRKLPHLCDAGVGVNRESDLAAYFIQLATRLRRVRVACGDWSRVLTPCVTIGNGMTGVFLDPPYSADRVNVYSVDSFDVSQAVREWAIKNGSNALLRIALCGYEGEHDMPLDWRVDAWKTGGGYGNQGTGQGKENAKKERIWFSPHCLRPEKQLSFW